MDRRVKRLECFPRLDCGHGNVSNRVRKYVG
jgi:hypothetical protein